MNRQIETLRKTRAFTLSVINELTVEQLNKIPEGFNNNIVWHLGHLLASKQGVCYVRSGNPVTIDEHLFNNHRPGTKPEGLVNGEEVETIKGLLISVLDQFETDYENHVFDNYTSWTTRYGVELNNIEEALDFIIYHEGLHLGYIMALKKLVNN
ncbi:DinB family protein [Solitalea longa]|uniref:DinB family protein n=1 Tax=Solitalea longa TaxID=2079460 RepID=A0A2S5A454_9SPHI|nr:DinB family protein [Solitalea longa]POY37358.1 DinB family protein [Solitalea longa]